MARTLFLALALSAAVSTTTAAAVNTSDAPADESFGPFKYTAISVRTKIGALGRSYSARWADDASLVHDAGLVESSFRVWAQRYPKDRWLAPTAFHLAQLYQVIQTQDARAHALAMYRYVAQTFPTSKEAHLARLRLAQGFPPLHAESALSPTPAPYASAAASPAASAGPGASAAPALPGASAAPGTSAAPSASAAPSTGAPSAAASPIARPPSAAPAAAPSPAPSRR
ncbi:MAG: hypothetical protein QOI11_3091 [Candidatus Eremiobacteraeota bacterium]|jgi:hypothetical protein|nr:hypothetical protein [Candidatus Eremiobacteraeota bacterium]